MFTLKSSRTRRIATIVLAGAVAAATLAGCSSSTSGSTTSAGGGASAVTAALKKGGTITYWSWTPSAKAQVAAFEKAYPKVKVNLVNAGTSTDEYTKLQNAIKAGTGGPDVAQVEYYAFPQFALSNSLLDLSSYGFGALKSKFTASTWNHVDIDGKIDGLPQDSGPMAMFYNKTIFDKYKLTVPTTWDEYIADAKKLTAADPTKFITNDTGDPGFATSMIWQAGGHPFTVDGDKVSINLADAGTAKWTAEWDQLIQGKLLSPITSWSDEWFKGLGDGSIATLITGAWMPGNLEASVPQASGDWRVAPIPTYDGKTAVTAENGGSGEAVLKQSKNPALAAGFLQWLNSSAASTKVFGDSGGFPSTNAELTASSFTDAAPAYFGGQKINQVLGAAATQVAPNWSYLPYQVYGNSIFGDTVGQSYTNSSALAPGLAAWQKQLVAYGNKQGFTVTSK